MMKRLRELGTRSLHKQAAESDGISPDCNLQARSGLKNRHSGIMQGKYFSFGATSAVLTGIAVIVGLSATADSAVSITTALIIFAVADNISDSFGIHIHQESQNESVNEVRRATFVNFLTRVLVVSIFVLLVMLLPVRLAVAASILFGLSIIAIISYLIAREQRALRHRVVLQHLLLTIAVIAASFVLRELIFRFAARFAMKQ
jgi:hypothetical protein